MQQLDSLIHAFSKRLLPYERLIMNAPSLKMIMRSVNVNELPGLHMVESGARFKLPDNFEMPGLTGNIVAKVILFPCHLKLFAYLSFLPSFLPPSLPPSLRPSLLPSFLPSFTFPKIFTGFILLPSRTSKCSRF